MDREELVEAIKREMETARESRAAGKEGRSRVCARRAAGLAIGWYAQQTLGVRPYSSAYKLLSWFQAREGVPARLREAAGRLTVRVTPEGQLPHEQDPLRDAQRIVMAVLEGRF
jgi:hypothetical protein